MDTLSDTLVYTKPTCTACGKGRESGTLEYFGNGVFRHLRHRVKVAVKLHKKREPKIIPETTVDQCLCWAGRPNYLCFYNSKNEVEDAQFG